MAIRGGPPLIAAARFPWCVIYQIRPYLWRMEEKAKRSGREQERRPPRQAAADRSGRQDGTAAAFSCVRPYI